MHEVPLYPDHLHVAAAAVCDGSGRVLLARRLPHLHQGGLWEFPGGKVEVGENAREAVVRELREELGIEVLALRPLLRVPYCYPDRKVLLDVWRVDAFAGTPSGLQGQEVRWVFPDDLDDYAVPAANRAIVTAVRLPDRYLITPEPDTDAAAFLRQLECRLREGIRLVQLRAKILPPAAYEELARQVLALCRHHGAQCLLNTTTERSMALDAAGVHLTAMVLRACRERPLPPGRWVAASCHTAAEVVHACAIGVDFLVVSPVQPTRSHPDAEPLGWDGLLRLTELATVPVYALGGMRAGDLPRCWQHGAQGIAAISGLWDDAASG